MIAPKRDLVLIKVDPWKDKTESGLLLVEEWKTLPPTGEVIAVGPMVKDLSVGDRVLFERYASVILENDERLCKESNVLAVLA